MKHFVLSHLHLTARFQGLFSQSDKCQLCINWVDNVANNFFFAVYMQHTLSHYFRLKIKKKRKGKLFIWPSLKLRITAKSRISIDVFIFACIILVSIEHVIDAINFIFRTSLKTTLVSGASCIKIIIIIIIIIIIVIIIIEKYIFWCHILLCSLTETSGKLPLLPTKCNG